MGLLKGAKGMVLGIVIMLFGGLMLSVGGYGVMEPIYSGIVLIGGLTFLASPLYYWVVQPIQEYRATTPDTVE